MVKLSAWSVSFLAVLRWHFAFQRSSPLFVFTSGCHLQILIRGCQVFLNPHDISPKHSAAPHDTLSQINVDLIHLFGIFKSVGGFMKTSACLMACIRSCMMTFLDTKVTRATCTLSHVDVEHPVPCLLLTV